MWSLLYLPILIGVGYIYYQYQAYLTRNMLKAYWKKFWSKPQVEITLDPGRKFLHIKYTNGVQPYNVVLPYNYRLVQPMSGTRVYLLRSNQPDLEITQQAGCPYITSAEKLGGTGFLICKPDKEPYSTSELPVF